jgi:pheromone shutdown protein TraB
MAENAAKRPSETGKIIFVPTSHVARDSLARVRDVVAKEKPDCVAVELDLNRYHSLNAQAGKSTFRLIRALGLSTFVIYWTLKKLQDYLGSKTGILPGSEMLEAVNLARAKGIDVALIDQPIEVTFYKIKKLPLGEKLGLFRLLMLAVVGMAVPFGKKEKVDLNRLPSEKLIDEAMAYLESELPGFYGVLVSERNAVMSSNLYRLMIKYEKIVCVVGAAHEKGIKKLLSTVKEGVS